MPKHLFKKLVPHPDSIKNNAFLRPLGLYLNTPCLWHFNRHNVSMAMAIGLFCMWIPFPTQSLIAALFAIMLRANLPIAVVIVFITNPVTIPAMFYFSYLLGTALLGQEPAITHFSLNMQWLGSTLAKAWKPLLLGCLIMSMLSSVIGYFATQLLWRLHILQRIRERKAHRVTRLESKSSASSPASRS